MRLVSANYRQNILLFLFFATVATALLAPISSNVVAPYVADFFNHFDAIIQGKLALLEGQFPLRVAPGDLHGWRYPLFQFYSPTSYLIASSIYRWVTPNNPFIAYKLMLWAALVLGGMSMYRLVLVFVKSTGAALLASLVYLTAPYYILLINQGGMFNEALALGLVPLTVLFTLQRLRQPYNNMTLIKMSFIWFCLATVHLITFVWTSFFVGLLIISLVKPTFKNLVRLIDVGIAYLFALVLSAWYLGPVIVLGRYFTGVKHIHAFGSLSDFLAPVANLFYAPGIEGDMTVRVGATAGLPLLIGAVIALFVINNKKFTLRKRDYWVKPLVGLFFLAFFIAWSPFNFWQWLPQQLAVTDYSWRLLSQVMWMGAILFAWAFCWLFSTKINEKHIVVAIIILVTMTSSWLSLSNVRLVPVDDFFKKPKFLLNDNLFLINPLAYLPLLNNIDSMTLYKPLSTNLMSEKKLQLKLNSPYRLSPLALSFNLSPEIILHAKVPAQLAGQDLIALINDVPVAKIKLPMGDLDWHFPLSAYSKLNTSTKIGLTFKTQNTAYPIELENIILSGFLNAKQTMPVKQVEPYCEQHGAKTVCNVKVDKNINLLELPVFFYPRLINVKVNGNEVSYQSVLYQDSIITGIVPEPGMNKVEVKFNGLAWANTLSEVAWCLWIFFSIYIVLNLTFTKRRENA